MCTSLSLTSMENHHFLARTMDFDFELNATPFFIPQGHTLISDLGATYQAQYALLGTGRKISDYVLVDGMNQVGFSGAALYFVESVYHHELSNDPKIINLASYEVLTWILSQFKDIADFAENIAQLNIVAAKNPILKINVPLHWLLADRSGQCSVLEARADGLQLLENPVGVMTNSPELEWHFKNLSNYTQLQPEPHPAHTYGNLVVNDFGPGSGTLGLPGDYTSPARFVRTSYLKNYAEPALDDQAALNTLIHILNNVDLVQGVKRLDQGIIEYTQYRAYFNLETLTYYIQPYQDQHLYSIQLRDNLLEPSKVVSFTLPTTQTTTPLN